MSSQAKDQTCPARVVYHYHTRPQRSEATANAQAQPFSLLAHTSARGMTRCDLYAAAKRNNATITELRETGTTLVHSTVCLCRRIYSKQGVESSSQPFAAIYNLEIAKNFNKDGRLPNITTSIHPSLCHIVQINTYLHATNTMTAGSNCISCMFSLTY